MINSIQDIITLAKRYVSPGNEEAERELTIKILKSRQPHPVIDATVSVQRSVLHKNIAIKYRKRRVDDNVNRDEYVWFRLELPYTRGLGQEMTADIEKQQLRQLPFKVMALAESVIDLDRKEYIKDRSGVLHDADHDMSWIECLLDFPVIEMDDFYVEVKNVTGQSVHNR